MPGQVSKRPLYRVLGWGAFLVILGLLVGFLPWPGEGRDFWAIHKFYDFLHFPAFAALGALWCLGLRGDPDVLRWRVRLVAGTAILAILMEWLQPLTGRSASMVDALHSLAGLAVGVAGTHESLRRAWRWSILGLAAFVVALGALEVLGNALAIRHREQSLPVLGDFETQLELRLWHPQGTDLHHCSRVSRVHCPELSGRGSLAVEPGPEDFPGVRFKTGSLDASHYEWILFRIHNPGKPLELIFRVDDAGSIPGSLHRFSHVLQVPTGTSSFRLPLQGWLDDSGRRCLNTSAILEMLWFQALPRERHVWCLDDVRLL